MLFDSNMKLRRSQHVYLHLRETPGLKLSAFFRGEIATAYEQEVVAYSPLSRGPITLDDQALDLLRRSSEHAWVPIETLMRKPADEDALAVLIRHGCLLTDRDVPEEALLRRREARLNEDQWQPQAALYHFATQWSDVQTHDHKLATDEDFVDKQRVFNSRSGLTERFGSPSPPFCDRREQAEARIELPVEETRDDFLALLHRRRTHRRFDREQPLDQGRLNTLLRQVFGCHGYGFFDDEAVLLKKTSPSGGAWHPIECHLLAIRVEGLHPGFYHYNVQDHALDQLETFSELEAEERVNRYTAHQFFYRTAAAVMILTARFHRNFWKYRKHAKSLRAIYMDAGHLGQTFYLLTEHLGLGAFYTAALNEEPIAEALKLDPYEQGPIAMVGCGVPLVSEHDLVFRPKPYRPRQGPLEPPKG